jgi:hypothetical protein
MLPFWGFYTRCTPPRPAGRGLLTVPYRLGHLSDLRLFWGIWGLSGAFLMAFPEELDLQNISLAIAPVLYYTHATLEPI